MANSNDSAEAAARRIAAHQVTRGVRIASHVLKSAVEAVEKLDASGWLALAGQSGVNADEPPSESTRGVALAVLRALAKVGE